MGTPRRTPWSRIKGQNSVYKEFLEIVGNGMLTGSVLKETIAVSDTIRISVLNRHSRTLLQDLLRSIMCKMHREPRVSEAEAQVRKWFDCRARITSKELAQLHSVRNGILRSACSTSQKMDENLGISALTHTAWLTNSLARSLKKMVTKLQWLFLKNTRKLGCVHQDMEPPKSSSILLKSSDIRKPIRCVKFTEAVARHADIRDLNPSLGMICPGDPHQRNPNAPKFEDRSQEET